MLVLGAATNTSKGDNMATMMDTPWGPALAVEIKEVVREDGILVIRWVRVDDGAVLLELEA